MLMMPHHEDEWAENARVGREEEKQPPPPPQPAPLDYGSERWTTQHHHHHHHSYPSSTSSHTPVFRRTHHQQHQTHANTDYHNYYFPPSPVQPSPTARSSRTTTAAMPPQHVTSSTHAAAAAVHPTHAPPLPWGEPSASASPSYPGAGYTTAPYHHHGHYSTPYPPPPPPPYHHAGSLPHPSSFGGPEPTASPPSAAHSPYSPYPLWRDSRAPSYSYQQQQQQQQPPPHSHYYRPDARIPTTPVDTTAARYGAPPSTVYLSGGGTSSSSSSSPPSHRKPPGLVSDVRDQDVLCGRGAPSSYHPGNQYFKELVSKYQPTYLASRRSDKPQIATQIVDIIRGRGGRFLKRTKVSGPGPSGHFGWQDIGDQRAYEKACQALRENAPEIRRRIAAKELASISADSQSLEEPEAKRVSHEATRKRRDRYDYPGEDSDDDEREGPTTKRFKTPK